jgi:GNAT superfamily N-acetyltransferase
LPGGPATPEFSIERVTEKTFPDFLVLLGELAGYEHLDPPDEGARLRLKEEILGHSPRCEAFLGRYGDESVGFVTFCFTYSTFLARPTLFLEDIFVRGQYRHHGFGTRLFDFCRGEAKVRGCGRMDWLVLRWNTPSIRFYEKAGAVQIAWHPYRLDREHL